MVKTYEKEYIPISRKKIETFDIINIFFLVGIICITLYPFLYMIAVSLSKNIYVLKNEITFYPKGLTFEMYKYVLSDPRIYIGYKNTIIYVVLGTFFGLLLTSTAAYALSRRGVVFGKTITMAFVFTMLFQGGMIPTFLVIKSLGLMDTLWAMVLPGACSVWNLIIMRTFFQGIPSELHDSGKIDGLSEIGIFAKIILPLSKPILATIGLFYAVALWNNFFLALLYLRDESLFPLQVILRNMVLAGQTQNGDIESAAGEDVIIDESLKFATIIVSTLPIIMVYPFIQKHFVKGVLIGSVKG
jgi:putative aldouronate transport system permease protein